MMPGDEKVHRFPIPAADTEPLAIPLSQHPADAVMENIPVAKTVTEASPAFQREQRARDLDAMLTPREAAEWLGVSLAVLKANRRIPVCKIGAKSRRYHKRTVLVMLASQAGVPAELIAASYGNRNKE